MAEAATRRLFFALWPASDLQRAIAERARGFHRETGGRVMRVETLHLTLAFIGSVDADRVPAIEAAASEVSFAPFDFVLDAVGFFPRKGIGWAGSQAEPEALRRLAEDLRASLDRAKMPFDPKPFVAHVTMLRNVERRSEARTMPPLAWRVEDFALVESVPADGRHEYRVIGRWPRG